MLVLGHGFSSLMKGKEGTGDLVQESLVILYNKILKQHFDSKRHLDSYLAHVLNNVRMNRYKRLFLTVKRKTGLEVGGVEFVEDKKNDEPYRVFEKSEDLERMARALQILNDKEMAILRMRHQDGMTWTEIGQIAGMSEDCVRKAHGRILGLMRSAMGLKVHVDWVE
jgi:RNA polymerase sigma factor (sigma-70 family)